MDLGECRNLHSTPLKMAYPFQITFMPLEDCNYHPLNQLNYDEEVSKGKNYGYEYELEKYLEQIVGDCDRKIQRAQKRLEETEKEKVTKAQILFFVYVFVSFFLYIFFVFLPHNITTHTQHKTTTKTRRTPTC